MEQSGFVVGIDLGTSKIVGLLGRKNEQGVISILASESIPSENCVKYGVVYNIEETAGKIKKLINLLENKSGRKIGKVYVSIAGKSMRAIEYTVSKDLGIETEVTFSIIDQMEQQARMNKPEFMANYSVVAPEIFLDGQLDESPLGKTATTVEGRYRLIVGRPNMKTNLTRSITDKQQLEIAGFIVGPVAAGAIVLDEEDKQKGCALVDFGAGTTTLSIYKAGLLRYMVVIPFGGRTITKDIKELGFIEAAAESYKIKYGRVGKDKNKLATSSSEVDVKELNKIIQLRVEEIILNLINQINLSGYGGQLDAGIIMIGGASQLTGLDSFLEEKTQMSVKRGSAKRLYINNVTDLLQNTSYTQCLGLLLFANENCEKKEQVIAPPVVEPISNQGINDINGDETKSTQEQSKEPVRPNHNSNSTQEEEEEETYYYEEEEEEVEEKPSKKKKKKKSPGIFDFFGKIQNLGGTMFKDED